ncbi:hypothetical protein GCM10020295_11150 [Streptomyces cinereospinus]
MYGTIRKPGVNGPNPVRAVSSVEKLTIVVVRPWKLSAATTIVARSAGTPLTSYAHLRATFTPLSTASAPVFMGSTMSRPVSAASRSANSASRSWWKAREVRVRRSSWRWAASTRAGWRWPKLRAE